MAKGKAKSTRVLWLQIIIGIIVLAWFAYDFFHTLFNGATYTLRFDQQLYFNENAIAFIIAMAIKLAFVAFCIWLVRDCYIKLKNL